MSGLSRGLREALSNTATRTVVAFAEELGVPNNSLTVWLKGKHHPRPSMMSQILTQIHVSIGTRRAMLEDFFDTFSLHHLGIVVVEPYDTVPDDAIIEDAARRFHETYEALAPDYVDVENAEHVAWEDLPEADRKLLVATFTTMAHRGAIALSSPNPLEPLP